MPNRRNETFLFMMLVFRNDIYIQMFSITILSFYLYITYTITIFITLDTNTVSKVEHEKHISRSKEKKLYVYIHIDKFHKIKHNSFYLLIK